MKSLKSTAPLALLLGCVLLASSCSEKEKGAASNSPTAPASEALTKIFDAPPAVAPVSIVEARASAKPGDTITLKGLVMGSMKPIVEGRAAFTLGDPEKLTPCNKNPDDACETPWDVCCETPEAIKASTVTVQVVDAAGKVLKEGIENVGGLKPLSDVTVTGVVAEGSGPDLLLLNASSIKVAAP